MKYYKLNNLENMMINILNENINDVWQEIEREKNALKRCEQRKLFWSALKKINNT